MLLLQGWLSINQSELLENLDKSAQGIKFEADVLGNSKVDLSIRLSLSERVVVGQDAAGNTTVKHPGEPQRVANYLDPAWRPGSLDLDGEWMIQNGQ